jgi:hypothetical protein
MARPKRFTDEELLDILATVEVKFGYIDVAMVEKAHAENPFEFPSEKTFKRRLGGMRTFNTPEFRERLQPHIDKLKGK